MVKLAGIFSKLQKINVLVIGDFMMDKYTYGNIDRISPEAPVSVLKSLKESHQPGGAGNVVLNLLALGANVMSIGRVGDDLSGKALLDFLKSKKSNIDNFLIQKKYQTPVKNRFIAENQQVLRVDFEDDNPLDNLLEKQLIDLLPSILQNINIVAISDYAKGFLTKNLIKAIITFSREKNIPVIVDPKGLDFKKYENASIIKPNLKEAYLAANLDRSADIETVADILLKLTKIDSLLVTRSGDGISLFSKENTRKDFLAKSKEVKDATGAGDTVLAMLCMALGNGLDLEIAAQLSNVAASIAIGHIGCYNVTLLDLAKRLLKYDMGSKIFDFSHLFALKKVLEDKKFSLIGINSKTSNIASVFKVIKKISTCNRKVVIYITDSNPKDDFIDLISSLNRIDFIILQNDNFKNLIEELNPEDVYFNECEVDFLK